MTTRLPKTDLRDLLDLVDVPVIVLEEHGAWIGTANASARTLFDLAADNDDGFDTVQVFGLAPARSIRAHLRDLDAGTEQSLLIIGCETALGLRKLLLKARRHPERAGVWIGTVEDRTGQTTDPDSDTWRNNLTAIINELPVGVEVYDPDFRELFANAHSDALLGYPAPAPLHHDDWWSVGFPDPAERARAIAEWEERIAALRADPGSTQSAEWRVQCRDGVRRQMQFRFRFIGENYTVVFWDVTEQRRLETELRRIAGTDALTGLCNRRRFFEETMRLMAGLAEDDEPASLMMLDIDHFKRINDTHGHAAGDQVLQILALRCQSALRLEDLMARLGGEEFAVFLPATGMTEAGRIAERLRAIVSGSPFALERLILPVRVSIGVATTTRAGNSNIERLMERADRALYSAKSAGRNRVIQTTLS